MRSLWLCMILIGCASRTVEAPAPPSFTEPTPPAAAQLPAFTTCPEGWTRGTLRWHDGALETCEPSRAPDCSGLNVPSGCVPSGSCVDGFPPAQANTVYVRAGASGSGSRDDPMGDLAVALNGTAAQIVVAPGEYSGSWTVTRAVRVRGVCAGTVHLHHQFTETAAATDAVLAIEASGVFVENLTISSNRVGIRVDRGAQDVQLDGIRIERATRAGVEAAIASRVVIRRSQISNVTPFGAEDVGAGVLAMGIVTIDDSEMAQNQTGLVAHGGSITANNILTVCIGASCSSGAVVLDAGTLTLRASRLSGQASHSLLVAEADSGSVQVFDSSLDAADPRTSHIDFWGGTNVLERVSLAGGGYGIFCQDAGPIRLTDVVVHDNMDPNRYAIGSVRCMLEATRFLALRASAQTAIVKGAPGVLTDWTIREPQRNATNTSATISVERGNLTAERVDIAMQPDLGINVSMGSTFTGADVRVVGIAPDTGRQAASAIVADGGSQVDLKRLVLEDVRGTFVFGVDPATSIQLEDFRATGNQSFRASATSRVAIGVGAIQGSSVALRRTLFHGVRGFVGFVSSSASLSADQCIVDGVSYVDGPDDRGATAGFVAGSGGNLTLDRFTVRNAIECALGVWQPESISVGAGTIEQNGIGVCIWPDTEIPVTRDVRFLDNETNVANVTSPVPGFG